MQLDLKFADSPLALHKSYISKNNDTLQIDVFRFYISGIEIHYTDKTVLKPQNGYHLIDIEKPESHRIPISKKENKTISKVIFNIGIDSTSSVSGALDGALDPSNGMYWAWQSGYINMKIEGKSSSCTTRKNAFQLHIGGYLKPYSAMRTIILYPNTETLKISVDIASLFEMIELSEINSVMIPGKKAMEIADYSVKMFKIE